MDFIKKNKKLLIIIGIVVLILGFFITKYNSLVLLNENVVAKESDIDVQLQRRADLIPNLVNTVKGYIKHEKDVIDSVTSAREKLNSANTIEEKSEANKNLTSALNNLLVLVENYPELKADTQFTALQDELAGTENRIAVARKDYNSAVTEFNKKIKLFPNNLLSGLFGFDSAAYFEVDQTAQGVPNVSIE